MNGINRQVNGDSSGVARARPPRAQRTKPSPKSGNGHNIVCNGFTAFCEIGAILVALRTRQDRLQQRRRLPGIATPFSKPVALVGLTQQLAAL
jgi:hypothetical protein